MAKKPKKEKNVSQGISAPPDWWEEVETAAADLSLGRSGFIRMAVNEYLKADGAKAVEAIPQAA